jgi:hypothetical protein
VIVDFQSTAKSVEEDEETAEHKLLGSFNRMCTVMGVRLSMRHWRIGYMRPGTVYPEGPPEGNRARRLGHTFSNTGMSVLGHFWFIK